MTIGIMSVIGKDRVGILSSVCGWLAECNVNILDITQTVLQGSFTMIMRVDVTEATLPIGQLALRMQEEGAKMGLDITLRHEDIFNAMHKL